MLLLTHFAPSLLLGWEQDTRAAHEEQVGGELF
jgi:hypothetical protein